MKNKSVKATVISFLLVITLVFVSSIILPDKSFSENENRPLATFPPLTIENLIGGKTGAELNSYVSDQMPLRDQLISLKSSLQIFSGKRDINGAYICSDGSYIEKVTADEKVIEKNLLAIKTFFDNGNLTAKYFIPVPTASQINSETLPKFAAPYNQKAFIEKAQQLTGFKTVNLIASFEKEAKTQELYYKSDHHWTSFAAHLAYREFLAVSGKKDDTKYMKETVADDFRGTLYSKVLYPFSKKSNIDYYKTAKDENYKIIVDDKTYPIYFFENLKAKDKYTFFLGGNYPKATCVGGSKGGGTLLLIKDSYANCFIPFLLGVYEKIVVIDPRYFVGDLNEVIVSEGIDDACILYSVDTLSCNTSVQLISQ